MKKYLNRFLSQTEHNYDNRSNYDAQTVISEFKQLPAVKLTTNEPAEDVP